MSGNRKLIAGGFLALAMASAGLAAVPTSVIDVKTGSNYSAGTGGGTLTYSGYASTYYLNGTHNWTSNNVYKLYGIILVADGAVLNIQPGTIIRGVNPYRTGSNFRPGMLIVMRGGKIFANGTANAPICMTDEWDNNFPWFGSTGSSVSQDAWTYYKADGSATTNAAGTAYNYGKLGDHHGCWGGLVLCGKAFVNWDSTSFGTADIVVEGTDDALAIKGGGSDDDDSSGEISYLQIRYGGYVLKSTKEINGVTFYGVGRKTKVHHIEVYNNIDDCYEWFGGTVNAKYLVAWGAGDDVFDSDCGFRGKNQFLFGVQRDLSGSSVESGASDKGMEIDGFEGTTASGAYLYPCSLWANVTLIGIQYTTCRYYSSGFKTQSNRNVALSMRDNASPRIYNSVFMDFGAVATLIENRTGGDLTGDLNVTARFSKAPTTANLPSVTYEGGATAGLSASSVANYLYSDGVMADDVEAAIRGTIFFNIPQGLVYSKPGGTDFTTDFSWAGSAYSKGPWLSTGAYAYGDFTNWYNNCNSDNSWANTNRSVDSVYMPIKARYRELVVKTATTSYSVTNVDPRAANDAVYSAMAVPDQWVTPVRFVGAFAPSNNWAKGWTTIDSLGALAAAPTGDVVPGGTVSAPQSNSTTYVTSYVTNTVTQVVTNTVTQVVTNGVNGIVYQSDTSLITSGTTLTASALTTSPVVTYSITAAGTYQLQYTASLTDVSWQVVKTFTVASASAGSPVTVNLTDIIGSTPAHSGDSAFYRLLKQ
jgi:hypothetical protein